MFQAKVNILYLVTHGEESRRNITDRGMERVRGARFCGVKVSTADGAKRSTSTHLR